MTGARNRGWRKNAGAEMVNAIRWVAQFDPFRVGAVSLRFPGALPPATIFGPYGASAHRSVR